MTVPRHTMTTSRAPSWEELLRVPDPRDHVVQLYSDEAFLARAVSQFIGPGLEAGEAAVVVATPEHAELIVRRLESDGVVIAPALARSQLLLLDAERSLAEFMVAGMPDRAAFDAFVATTLDRIRTAGCAKTRFFGEMVNLLWKDNLLATVELERLWKTTLAKHGGSLLCAYGIDNFDPQVHRGVLREISRSHSHLIPVEDYRRLERAVTEAYADIFGGFGDAESLRSLLVSRLLVSRHAFASAMPAAETALLALRLLPPALADSVLDRARLHYGA